MNTVTQVVHLHQLNTLYWSDLMDVLCWIKTNHSSSSLRIGSPPSSSCHDQTSGITSMALPTRQILGPEAFP